MKLKGKVAIITGSSSGIGEATAVLFAQEGARVVVTCLSSVDKAEGVVNKITSAGGEAFYLQGDVSDEAFANKLIADTCERFGTVDILVNNAGKADDPDFFEMTKEDWLNAFNTNFFGTVLCSQAAARIMVAKKTGKILNCSSIYGLEHAGKKGLIAYSAAKAAVNNFTRTLAKELAPDVMVNAVAPGFVETPGWDGTSEDSITYHLSKSLLKRWIAPQEVAEAFLYLATADALTGEVLVLDAGTTLVQI